MNKCSKVKNPCKICLESVTPKTGVQCKGACKKWVHFTCLHFTPGKIQDIKAGLITITCPCPNCNTKTPREILTDPPFTCTNRECPANKPPTCQIDECPLNRPAVSRGVSPYLISPPPCGPACSTSKKSSHYTPPVLSPKMTRIPPAKPTRSPQAQPPSVSSQRDIPPCMSLPVVSQMTSPPRTPVIIYSRSPTHKDVYTENSFPASEVRSQSCSCMSGRADADICETADAGNQGSKRSNDETIVLKSGDCKASCSDSKLSNTKENQKVLLCTIHQLCSTVGHLSCQIKDLMCTMMTTIEKDA